jgi:hypothetical protein
MTEQDSEEAWSHASPLTIVRVDVSIDGIAREGARERARARRDVLVAQRSNGSHSIAIRQHR